MKRRALDRPFADWGHAWGSRGPGCPVTGVRGSYCRTTSAGRNTCGSTGRIQSSYVHASSAFATLDLVCSTFLDHPPALAQDVREGVHRPGGRPAQLARELLDNRAR